MGLWFSLQKLPGKMMMFESVYYYLKNEIGDAIELNSSPGRSNAYSGLLCEKRKIPECAALLPGYAYCFIHLFLCISTVGMDCLIKPNLGYNVDATVGQAIELFT